MDTSQVECVFQACRTRSFSEAAKSLYMSAAAFSGKVDALEREVGFRIFNRSNRGVTLTSAGQQFCTRLIDIDRQLHAAIEQGRNADGKESMLTVTLPMRSSLSLLPQVMDEFRRQMPGVEVMVDVCYDGRMRLNRLLDHQSDVIFSHETLIEGVPEVSSAFLFESGMSIVMRRSDPLARKGRLSVGDFAGRRFIASNEFMQRPCCKEIADAMNLVLDEGNVQLVYCSDFESALAYVATGEALMLSVDYANNGSGEFAWRPLDCGLQAPCLLVARERDSRRSTGLFIDIARRAYASQAAPALHVA